MGTRNLTLVVKDGKAVIAQYGQWDGYPAGQGVTALSFLRADGINRLLPRLVDVRFGTDDEVNAILKSITGNDSGWLNMEEAEEYNRRLPFIGRDHGAAVLSLIADSEPGTDIILSDGSSFAKDGLFCEYAYVIDLDANRFEAYVGFQTTDHEDGRFASLAKAADFTPEYEGQNYYAPVRLAASWSLEDLPDDEEFERTINAVENYYRMVSPHTADLPTPTDVENGNWDEDEYGPTPIPGPVIAGSVRQDA